MKYMLLLNRTADALPEPGTPELDQIMQEYGAAVAEIKEQLGGYTIVECADLDEALKWAAAIPAARDASVEIRPIVAMQAPG